MIRPVCICKINSSTQCKLKQNAFLASRKAAFTTTKFDGLKEPAWSVSLFLKNNHKTDLITTERLNHLCQISRLALDENYSQQIKTDLGMILNFVGHVQDADTQGLKPLHSVVEKYANQEQLIQLSQPPKEQTRENAEHGTPILNNAKVTFRSYFAVPKVKET